MPNIYWDCDCDIFHNTWRTKFLPSVARQVAGHHCPDCKILLIDYGNVYVGNEARELAKRLIEEETGEDEAQ